MSHTVRLNVLTEDEIQQIHQATLEVLERTGVKVICDEALELLRDAGCEVDGDIVHIPPQLVEEAIDSAPETFLLYDRNGENPMPVGGWQTYYGTGVTNLYFRDIQTGDRRPTRVQDIRDAAKLCDFLPNYDWIMPLGSAQDAPQAAGDVYEFEAAVTNTTKPIVFITNDRKGTQDVLEMASVVAGGRQALIDRPFVMAYPEPASPLFHVPQAAEKLLYSAEFGMPVIYTPCPMSGGTAPVTMASLLAIVNAECLSGLVMAQLKNKGIPFVIGGVPTIMDMARGTISYGAPEMSLALSGYADIAHHYRLPTWGTAGCSDSKLPDEQAAIESTFSCLMNGLAGINMVHDPGFINSGLMGSLEMLVMTNEIIGMVRRMLKGIPVNEETLATDVIQQVGPAGHFLTQDHTVKHFRREHWFPNLMDRTPYEQWAKEGRKSMADRVKEETLSILESHVPEPLDDDTLRELRVIRERSVEERTASPV
jgi:trimethylamine--corrinoid protein Co-methyltransferase